MSVGKGSQSQSQQQAQNFQSAAENGAVNFGATYIAGGTGGTTVSQTTVSNPYGTRGAGSAVSPQTNVAPVSGVVNTQTAATGGGVAFGAGSTTNLTINTTDAATAATALSNEQGVALSAIQGLEAVALANMQTAGAGGAGGTGGNTGSGGIKTGDLVIGAALIVGAVIVFRMIHH